MRKHIVVSVKCAYNSAVDVYLEGEMFYDKCSQIILWFVKKPPKSWRGCVSSRWLVGSHSLSCVVVWMGLDELHRGNDLNILRFGCIVEVKWCKTTLRLNFVLFARLDFDVWNVEVWKNKYDVIIPTDYLLFIFIVASIFDCCLSQLDSAFEV